MEGLPMASTSQFGGGLEFFWCQIFDPDSRFMKYWILFEMFVGVFNIFVDPLFAYLVVVSSNSVVMDFDSVGTIIMLRTIGDSFHLLGMIVKFRTAYEVSSSTVFRKRELVKDPKEIAKKYLKSVFFLDLLAILPLPQIFLWIIIPTVGPSSNTDNHIYSTRIYSALPLILCLQIFPRLLAMFPLSRSDISQSSGMFIKNDWSGAAYSLLIYIMISHMVGATHYALYISRLLECKEIVLQKGMSTAKLDWDQLLIGCSMKEETKNGMFSDVYENKIGSRHFTQRFMYCFSWALKCLSSMGQNFNASFLTPESIFTFLMTIFGLLLFAGLIALMQTSIQAMGSGEDLQIVRQREIEEWTKQHNLPLDLRKRIRDTVLSEWRMTRGLDNEAIMFMLPSELQCEIRRHLYLDLAGNLPFFLNMDEQLIHSFCGYLRTFSSSKGLFIAVEGEPLRRMFFIFSGQLEVLLLNGGCSTPPILGPGDICGEELISWASIPSASTQNLPLSGQTLKCHTDVEAFFIYAEDLKLLAHQFDYTWNFQQMMRLHST